ncbi:sporulation protein YpjB [Gracilibacillus ureilyticus]|uniref:Sporulation protein YpjB n=1 Tax=Gracilibacillus ureilyticus TaxID=531814 RepID=A0A1H9LNH2_9BACI|nr:sporulation protein YpjB [Gracilibacillus ureilyticus]SER12898.1 sporulation protein YpjB [Gracilibacillus ureilyticus]
MRINSIIFFIIIICLFHQTIPLAVQANTTSNELYTFERYVQEQRYPQAIQKLEQIEDSLITSVQKTQPARVENLEVLINNNLEHLLKENITVTEKSKMAQQLVVMYDALINSDAPLWHRWKSDLETNIHTILTEKSIDKKQTDEIVYRWEVISPVLSMYLPEEEYNELELMFINFGHINVEEQHSELQSVFNQMSLINLETIQNSQFQSYSQWLMFIVIGFIFLTLSYVGWVRYKAESSVNHTN